MSKLSGQACLPFPLSPCMGVVVSTRPSDLEDPPETRQKGGPGPVGIDSLSVCPRPFELPWPDLLPILQLALESLVLAAAGKVFPAT